MSGSQEKYQTPDSLPSKYFHDEKQKAPRQARLPWGFFRVKLKIIVINPLLVFLLVFFLLLLVLILTFIFSHLFLLLCIIFYSFRYHKDNIYCSKTQAKSALAS